VKIPQNDQTAIALAHAVRNGDLVTIGNLLAARPTLARARFVGCKGGTKTLLHLVADWPGYFPNAPQAVELSIRAGANPDSRATDRDGRESETPLHWAASSDDLEVAAALIDGGADIEAPGGSIAGGTPLTNAVGYGCWHVARLLVGRGARVASLWEAAALGDRARVDELLESVPAPTDTDLNDAFWQACHGGQRRMAEYLLARGADINAIPGYSKQTPLQVAGEIDTRHQALVDWLRQRGALEG